MEERSKRRSNRGKGRQDESRQSKVNEKGGREGGWQEREIMR